MGQYMPKLQRFAFQISNSEELLIKQRCFEEYQRIKSCSAGGQQGLSPFSGILKARELPESSIALRSPFFTAWGSTRLLRPIGGERGQKGRSNEVGSFSGSRK